jgi:hypothetical protein
MEPTISRRAWLAAAVAAIAPLATARGMQAGQQQPVVRSRKQVGCPCCDDWVVHMRRHGFTVNVSEDPDLNGAKRLLGIPQDLWSCHTSVVGNYVVEGHVPADEVQRLLAGKPDIVGIAVGGMPIGSPGMEGPNPQVYDVIAFRRDGTRSLWARKQGSARPW